jgi:hypothetical protein
VIVCNRCGRSWQGSTAPTHACVPEYVTVPSVVVPITTATPDTFHNGYHWLWSVYSEGAGL